MNDADGIVPSPKEDVDEDKSEVPSRLQSPNAIHAFLLWVLTSVPLPDFLAILLLGSLQRQNLDDNIRRVIL